MSMFRTLLLTILVAGGVNLLLADNLDPTKVSLEPTKVSVLANQQYGPTNELGGRCDVYLPAAQAGPSGQAPALGHPVVILVPGGAWVSGDKSQVERYARALAHQGYVAIAINYARAPQHHFPAQVDSLRTAMLWTKRNATRFNVDVRRLGLFGYSAGGHLVTLVAALADEPIEVRATTSRWSKQDSRWRQLPKIHAVCAGAPPTDFRQVELDNPTYKFFLGQTRRAEPELYVAASPATYVSPADPVTQILHGDLDVVVPRSASEKFHRAQRAAGVDSRLQVLQNQGHVTTFFNQQSINTTVKFFDEVFGSSLAAATSRYR
jgi:triacylglycerol lipase